MITAAPGGAEGSGVTQAVVGCQPTSTSPSFPHLGPKASRLTVVSPRPPDQVLKMCAPAPAVIEVLLNSYPQLRVSESWREVIPEEVFQVRGRLPSAVIQHCPLCLLTCEEVCTTSQVSTKHLEEEGGGGPGAPVSIAVFLREAQLSPSQAPVVELGCCQPHGAQRPTLARARGPRLRPRMGI